MPEQHDCTVGGYRTIVPAAFSLMLGKSTESSSSSSPSPPAVSVDKSDTLSFA